MMMMMIIIIITIIVLEPVSEAGCFSQIIIFIDYADLIFRAAEMSLTQHLKIAQCSFQFKLRLIITSATDKNYTPV